MRISNPCKIEQLKNQKMDPHVKPAMPGWHSIVVPGQPIIVIITIRETLPGFDHQIMIVMHPEPSGKKDG